MCLVLLEACTVPAEASQAWTVVYRREAVIDGRVFIRALSGDGRESAAQCQDILSSAVHRHHIAEKGSSGLGRRDRLSIALVSVRRDACATCSAQSHRRIAALIVRSCDE